ncbi:MAG TPA: hypothetical protein VGE01_13590, partial [Fimbriimonas sp.]
MDNARIGGGDEAPLGNRDARCWQTTCESAGLARSRMPFPETATGELGWRVYCEVAGSTLASLENERSAATVLDSVRAAAAANDRYLDLLPSETRTAIGTAKLACGPGCAFCCCIRITTVAPYVLLMEQAVRSDPPSIPAVLESIRAYRSATDVLPPRERVARLQPCPLLRGSRCAYYAARPASCRGCHSYDARECAKDDGSRIPRSVLRQMVQFAVTAGYDDALGAVGLDVRELEFVPALEIALTGSDVAERWAGGE